MQFSLMFFGSKAETPGDRYGLVQHCARYADENGLSAVWVPERHFSRLGGLFANPSVVLASLATITKHVSLRTGSIVLPLHEPMHVVETFSAVDNLSKGRVGLGFAAGWNPDDFAFVRDRYADRADRLFQSFHAVQQLWSTGSAAIVNGLGNPATVTLYPPPVQSMPPMWIAAGRSPATFQRTGAVGANLLTHMLDVDIDQLGERVALYRRARRESGLYSGEGHVTVMLHTYMAGSDTAACEEAKSPYCEFIKSNIALFGKLADSRDSASADAARKNVSDNIDELAGVLFDRFHASRSLIGSFDRCAAFIRKLKAIGVDEIACLLDFGPSDLRVKESLGYIRELHDLFSKDGNDGASPSLRGISDGNEGARTEFSSQSTADGIETKKEDCAGENGGAADGDLQQGAGIYFQMEWLPVALRLPSPSNERWNDVAVLFAGDAPLAEALAEEVRQRGGEVYIIEFGAEFQQMNSRFVIEGERDDHYGWVLDIIVDQHQGQNICVVDLVSLSVRSTASRQREATASGIDLCYDIAAQIAKASAERSAAQNLRLLMFTANAACIPEYDGPINIYNALTLCVGRVLEYECQSLETRVIDLEEDAIGPTFAKRLALYVMEEAASAAKAPKQLAIRGEHIFAQVLVEQRRSSRPEPGVGVICVPEASYLISGGLGALGLLFASWLVGKGAKTLILCHRRDFPSKAAWTGEVRLQSSHAATIRRLQKLEADGATVHIVRMDVVDLGQVTAGIEELYGRGVPKIAGVLHAAGVAPDFGRFESQDPARAKEVMAPKIMGALNLHHALAGAPLDFFVLFSSWAGLLGAVGQNLLPYSAANGFLDALSHHRRQSGLASLSVSWGDWAATGMRAAAEARGEANLLPLDWAITPSRGMNALEDLLGSSEPAVSVTPVDWNDFAALFPQGRKSGLLRRVAKQSSRDVRSLPAGPRAAPTEAAEIEAWLLRLLAEKRNDIVALDMNKALAALGFDSLGILDIRAQVKTAFGFSLPLSLLMNPDTTVGHIAKKLAEEGRGATALEGKESTSNTSAPSTQTLQLSFSQERMWILNQMNPDDAAYNMFGAFRLKGRLDVDALRAAVRALIVRHEALRTAFESTNGVPYQRIDPASQIDIDLIDCRHLMPEEIDDLVNSRISQHFDLSTPPLMRLRVFERGDEDRYLTLEVHHIIVDGWSIGILLSEIEALYAHQAFEETLSLPSVEARYSEFVATQRAPEFMGKIEGDLDFWKRELDGAAELPIPADYHLGSRRGIGLHRVRLCIDDDECLALSKIARSNGVSGYTLLFGLFALMLHEFCDTDDIVVGLPEASREDTRFRNTLGLFANTIPIRLRVEERPELNSFLKHVHEKVINGMEHARAPFEQIVSITGARRRADRNPLYRVLFAPQVVSNDNLQLRGLTVTPLDVAPKHSVVDITASVTLKDGRLSGYIEFDGRLFAPETAECMTARFHELASRVARSGHL